MKVGVQYAYSTNATLTLATETTGPQSKILATPMAPPPSVGKRKP